MATKTKPAQAPQAPPADDPLAILTSMAAAKPAGKKSGSPQISAPELDAAIDTYIEAKRASDAADSTLTMAADQVRTGARPLLIGWCRQHGKMEASIRLNGKLSLVVPNKYSAVPAEHMPAIRQVFGEAADRYFRPQLKIGLTEAAAADEGFLKKLISAVGPEFATRFTVQRTFAVTEQFHVDSTLNPEVAELAAPLLASEIVKQTTPSLKL